MASKTARSDSAMAMDALKAPCLLEKEEFRCRDKLTDGYPEDSDTTGSVRIFALLAYARVRLFA